MIADQLLILSRGLPSKLSPTAVAILSVVTVVFLRFIASKSPKNLPPGPKGLPVLGNILDIISAGKEKRLHLLFENWAREYGDVMLIRSGVEDEFYINSRRAAKQIMDTNTALTSERPRWIVSCEHICGNWNVLLLPASNPRWKEQRRVTNQNLTSMSKAEAAVPFLEFEVLKFLHEVAHDPDGGTDKQNLWDKMGRYIYSTFTTQLFGLEIKTSDSPTIGYLFETGAAQIEGINPGAELVDSFPLLDHLPNIFRKSQVSGDVRFKRDVKWSMDRLTYLKSLIKQGRAPDCFLSRVLQDENLAGVPSEEEAAFLSLQLVLGGSDTSRMAAWSFMELMLENPREFAKLQALIDQHCGDRLPMWTDFAALPHVRCVMKEVWRMRPPVSIGMLAHTSTKDIEYDGYVIPKGARLKLNTWAIGHDPRVYENAREFKPERYKGDTLNSQESANLKDATQRDHFAFGVGRRSCPGMHVAERSFAIAIMRLAWAFDIKPAPRAKFPIKMEDFPHYIPGIAGIEMPINIVPRNAKRLAQLDGYFEEALAARPQYGSLDMDS
ncbi:cytochrome P450 [Ilyonectria sp. MPI-CAGE-AT-0026]|nr:cytochrome P450 [Ilyonectria sp. MPI-CAGE-AT-0026]